MSKLLTRTSERIIPEHFLQSKEAYLLYLKHLFAYESVKKFIPENSSVMEVGCGDGYGTHYLAQHVQHIIGLDVNKDVIQYASSKYNSENCSFKLYDGTKIPYADNTFNVVVSFQVIEHVQDDKNFLTEIHRILKTDGMCFLTTPNRSHRVKPDKKPWNRFHIREYYPDEFEGLLTSVFSEVRVWGIHGNHAIQAIEQARIKQIQKFVDMDRLNLRKFLPVSYEMFIVSLLKKFLKSPNNQSNNNFLNAYSTDDYAIAKDHIEDSLDLLAICRS